MSADRVSREEIKPQVIMKLEVFAGPGAKITESTHLQRDLGMGPTYRAAMAMPYTKISKRYCGYVVKMSETRNLTDVRQSITLVYRRANRNR